MFHLCVLLILTAAAAGAEERVIRSVDGLVESLGRGETGVAFDLTGDVEFIRRPDSWQFSFTTDGKTIPVIREEFLWKRGGLAIGNRVRLRGTTRIKKSDPARRVFAYCSENIVLGHADRKPFMVTDPASLRDKKLDFRYVELTGQVVDAYIEDGPERWHHLILHAGNDAVHAHYVTRSTDLFVLKDLIGATVSLRGEITHDDPLRLVSLAMSGPEAIELLVPASWWTPVRLVTVFSLLTIGLLVLTLVFRTRRLSRERAVRQLSEMRIAERTRLAVELHDALSQMISGISMQLDGARRHLEKRENETAASKLGIASQTLRSCRDELKNCLFDLRNSALDDVDLDRAIRTTLEPFQKDVRLVVRFNVPRSLLSDNCCHALLRIIRELTVNAVRHGHARCVRIAGTIENGRLLFSVTDDGTGFDPSSAPGIELGHFGLQGIRERIESLGGRLDIDSSPTRGTRIAVAINASDGNLKQ